MKAVTASFLLGFLALLLAGCPDADSGSCDACAACADCTACGPCPDCAAGAACPDCATSAPCPDAGVCPAGAGDAVAAPDGLPRDGRPDALDPGDQPAAPELPLDAGPGDTAGELGPLDPCTFWQTDHAVENLASLRHFALRQATAVVEGTLAAPTALSERPFVSLHVEAVHRGAAFLQGLDVLVEVAPTQAAQLPEGSRWLVGLSGRYPSVWEQAPRPVWGNGLAFVPAADAPDYADDIGFDADRLSHVAIVRIVAQDEYRTTFEVLDALKGTWPATFSDNWYGEWALPYPAPAADESETYVAGVDGLTAYPDDDLVIGTVLDFRPATPDTLADVLAALASPADEAAQKARLVAQRDDLRDGLRFHDVPVVVASLVTGFAEECCTGAGGTYVSHAVEQVLSGMPPAARFVTGGHAYYGGEGCGDAFLYALDALVDPSPALPDDFDCLEYPQGDVWYADGPDILSPVAARRPGLPAEWTKVMAWVAASDPLYRLWPAGAAPVPEALLQNPQNAPWSEPRDAAEAFALATHIALVTVESAAFDPVNQAHVVQLSTTFSIHEYEHLPRHTVQLAFRCGDPRLTVVGARYVAPLVLLEPYSWDPAAPLDLGSAFLIPGALLPEWAVTPQLESILAQHLQ